MKLSLSFDCFDVREFRLLAQQPTDQDLTTPNRGLHLSSSNSEATHDQHHSMIAPFLHQSQQITHSNNAGPISTGTSTSSNSQSQATAPSAMHMPKAMAGIGSTVDRTAFRQQPPPMKVDVTSRTKNVIILCVFRRVNHVSNRFIVMHRYVRFVKLKVGHVIRRNPNVVTQMSILEKQHLSLVLNVFFVVVYSSVTQSFESQLYAIFISFSSCFESFVHCRLFDRKRETRKDY